RKPTFSETIFIKEASEECERTETPKKKKETPSLAPTNTDIAHNTDTRSLPTWGLHSNFASKSLPFCHERFAASTSTTCKTSTILCETEKSSHGKRVVPKSQKRQTLLTMPL